MRKEVQMKFTIGIDWSSKKHDVQLLDENGEKKLFKTIEHTPKGFAEIEKMREAMSATHDEVNIGLETAHTLLIDHLWACGYENIYVIPPNVVKKTRSRHNQSGARDDRFDAYVIADLLRTDKHRFYPWHPGSELLQQMRAVSSATLFWTKQTVMLANRLGAYLTRYHPAILNVFSAWPSRIACELLLAYPTPETAQNVTYEEFKVFLKKHRHSYTPTWVRSYDKLVQAHPTTPPGIVAGYKDDAVRLANQLLVALQNEEENLLQLGGLFDRHPDRHIFASLPGAGLLLAPSLLVKFGEDRKRFPAAQRVQTLAGTAPVTKQSGKARSVHFRRACDKDFRYFMQQFARCSVSQSEWAASYFHSARASGHSLNRAYRGLANRWSSIIWRMWQDGTTYDESFHLTTRKQRRAQKA